MVTTEHTWIHGIDTTYAGDGVMVSYVYPGPLQLRPAAGAPVPEQRIDLGLCLADPDTQDPRDDHLWRWQASTRPATRIWARHVLALHAAVRTAAEPPSLVYEHADEVVLVWGFIPARADELDLLAAGFRPALATWRAPATAGARELAERMARVMPVVDRGDATAPREFGEPPPPLLRDPRDGEHAEWVEHAWMRWAALTRSPLLAPAQRDGAALVLRLRSDRGELRVVVDAARHPLIYDVTVSVTAGGDRRAPSDHRFPGVAWADFPRLLAAIDRIVAAPAPVKAEPARARGPAKKRRTPEAPARIASPSWVEAVLDHFNREPGPRLALQRERANGAVFVVHAEDATRERPLASIDVLAGEVEEVRWIDATLRGPQREAILARMDRALDAAADAPEGERPSPLDELIALMRRRGLVQLGVDLDATGKLDRTDGYRPLAEALRDLAEPAGVTPAALQDFLERADLMDAAEVVSRAVGADPPPLRALMQTLWAELDEAMPLYKISLAGPRLRVPEECLFEDSGHTLLLVAGARPHMTLRRVRVRVLERPEDSDTVLVEDTTDSLVPGDAIHRGGDALHRATFSARPLDFITEVNVKVREFEATLARAPQALEDVRRLLYWSAAMIGAPRCQGELKAATHKSFQLARSYYETARKRLIEGRTGDAVRQMHEALRRISSSAAELAMNCAEGQLTIAPPNVLELVRPEDAAAVRG